MAGTNTVCSMCGDVGFPDKIFRCNRCRSRFQHWYCSSYYKEEEEPVEVAGVCDWCLSAERSHTGPSEKVGSSSSPGKRLEYSYPNPSSSDCRVKREDTSWSGGKGSTPSKQSGRRYKLLKDVLC